MRLSPSAHLDTFCRDHLPAPDSWPEFDFTLPELAYPAELNCAAELVDGDSDRRCLLGDGEVWTYAQVADRARRVAAALTDDQGLVPGNRVLLRGPNNPWLVVSWLGGLLAGGVVVTTMPLLRPGELATIGEISQPTVALCDPRFLDDLVLADIPGLRILTYDDLQISTVRADFTPVRTAADDVAMLAFTSGTTGRPKATMHFHRDVLAIADTYGRHVLQLRPTDLVVGTPPLAFTFGLGALVIFPLRAGAATLLLEKAAPELLVDAIEEHAVTVVFTAPIAYRAMLSERNLGRISSLRRCVSAGEHLSAAIWSDFREKTGIRILDGIGATEMLHIFLSRTETDDKAGSTGRPVPGYQAIVVGPAGDPVPDGTPGQLAVRGPTGCRYLADDRQHDYVRNGWNITGDTYIRDTDGWFWFQARSDDMIVSAGYNIAGPEVEEALLRHPDVAECAVVGAPDDLRGTVVKAVVVPTNGVLPDVKALQDFVKSEIAPYKYPRIIEFRTELPRTATGKLQRYRLR
ncbi:AMP-binding protein [Fodinicola feengrottensis]|uniref:Aminobenozate:CoA ligase AmbL n=1 Tax=Fodinicola feengrottensis TaxID=435914 RepID=A0ABN2FNM3_9ACTN|nr:AMP-binding protein [Fodinicola feengrottensis]